jgi:hypothetical protein
MMYVRAHDKFGDFRTNICGIRDTGAGPICSVINREVPVIQKSPKSSQMCLSISGSDLASKVYFFI